MTTIIGGTYREINYDGISSEIFGSGLRCCNFFLENKSKIKFYTSGNSEIKNYLEEYKKVYTQFNYNCQESNDFIAFKYSFGLDNPTIFPSILNIKKTKDISVNSENVICFGMLESNFLIDCEKIIYDPQTSFKPIKFSEFGKAQQLIYIVNMSEAKSISRYENLNEIKDFFFNEEKVYALIIKDGPFGATLFFDNKEIKIPSYITENVNKIGSGDIFTSSFGYYWMEKKYSIEDSAKFASKSTALYCDKLIFQELNLEKEFQYEEFQPIDLENKQIYLASPIFSLSQIILIDKIRKAFLTFGVKVFSPFHDIGLGESDYIAEQDIIGIENSNIVFCLFDGQDSGTLIEAGYSMAKNKKMIGYQTICESGSLLMLKPSNIKIYSNLTTAIYQTIWNM